MISRASTLLLCATVAVGASLAHVAAMGGGLPQPSTASIVVDLDQPGALEALARQNPAHYAKIEKIVADVTRRPPETVPRWLAAEFGAQRVSFPWLLKTSDPAKRSLSFSLDTTRYEMNVAVPTRWSFATR